MIVVSALIMAAGAGCIWVEALYMLAESRLRAALLLFVLGLAVALAAFYVVLVAL